VKWILAMGAILLAAPVLTLGLLAAVFSASTSSGSDCSSTATSDTSCGTAGDQGVAAAIPGSDGLVNDPTTSGRITRRMLHTYNEVNRVFNGWPWGISCWDPHLWNPSSDHPRGRACDFTVGRIGRFPSDAQRTTGWQLARWAQRNADTLGISYIIWDGRIWSASRLREGWRTYDGAGIYNPKSPTGGHYDHVHVSVRS
jgi:hypothetical protein